MHCKITYTFRCFECGKTEEVVFTWWAGTVIPTPSLPEGWVVAGDGQFCAGHEIFLSVDRKKNYPVNLNSKNGPKLV